MGDLRIMYWPRYYNDCDFHWARMSASGAWLEKRGETVMKTELYTKLTTTARVYLFSFYFGYLYFVGNDKCCIIHYGYAQRFGTFQ